MSEKQLYTLTDIAQKLSVNYKTLYNYKDVFKEFLVVQDQGRQTRYLSINIEIFRKILEMKDDGATNADVHEVLSDWRNREPEIFESGNPSFFPSVAPSCLPPVSRSFDPSFFPSLDLSVFPSFLLDVVPSVFPSFSPSVFPSFSQGRTFVEQASADETAYETETCARSDANSEGDQGTVQFDTNQSVEALGIQAQHFQPGPDLEMIQDLLDHSLSRLESRILSEVNELLPQMNSALTQFYKFWFFDV
ncbi:MerR HTH family regulatory protein [Desulfonatronum zhilinae]|nr:MerR HTH family regulatory protein [Desulfonatronum zhilinae]